MAVAAADTWQCESSRRVCILHWFTARYDYQRTRRQTAKGFQAVA